MLGVPVKYTTAVDEFIVHGSLKFSYGNKPLGEELHLKAHETLFEQGITDVEIKIQDWDGVPCFFSTPSGDLPYDIFAAAFVLLSRYEEYLPHVKDAKGRFPASESLALQHGFLHLPVVDIWMMRFREKLSEKFPNYKWPSRKAQTQAVIDVEQAYDFYKVGFIREVSGIFKDLFKFRFSHIMLRIRVKLGLRKDPYDTFSWLINVQKNAEHRFIYFFQLGDFSTYTKNIRFNKGKFRELIKMIADYSEVGLYFSKEALESESVMKTEKKRLLQIINKPLDAVRCTHHMAGMPKHYRDMIVQDALNDYSMGYDNVLGFRAGTCTPFLFYDLDHERVTPLMVHSVCANSTVFEENHHENATDLNEQLDRFLEMRKIVEQVGGYFIFSFKNRSFTGKAQHEGQWKQFFRQLIHV